MNKTLKKIILYFSFILVCLGIFIGSLHSLINVNEIKKVTLDSIERAFPNISVEFSDLSYSLTTSLKIFGEDLVVKIKNRKSSSHMETLFKMKSFELKIPLMSVIFNGGRLRLKGHFPELNFEQYEQGNNWRYAFTEQKIYKELEVLSFITNSRLNFIFYHSKINHRDEEANAKTIELDKVLIKDLNSSSTTAYEISSPINYVFTDNKNLEANLLAIGQVNLKKYLANNLLESFLITKLTDVKYSDFDRVIPLVQNSITVTMERNGQSQLSIDTKIGQILDVSSHIVSTDEKIEAKSLSARVSLKDTVKFLSDKQKKKLNVFDFKNTKLLVEGSFQYNKLTDVLIPDIRFETDRDFFIGLPYSINFDSTVKGTVKKEQLNFDLISKIFDGVVTTSIETNLIYRPRSKQTSGFDSYKASVEASGIKLEEVNFRDIFYPNESPVLSPKVKITRTRDSYVSGEIALNFKQTFINENNISLNGILKINPYSVVGKDLKFTVDEGRGTLNYYSHKDEDNIKTTKIDSSFTKTPLNAVKLFLPNYFDNYTGFMTGDMGVELVKDFDNTISTSYANLTLENGKFGSIDFGKYVSKFLNNNNFFKKSDNSELVDVVKELGFDGNFSVLKLKGGIENSVATINSLELVDKIGKFELNANGTLYLKERDKKSYLELQTKYKNSKASNYFKKIIGTNEIPLMLVGEGLELILKPEYTIEKLLSEVLKDRAGNYIDKSKFKKALYDNNIEINPALLKGIK